MIQRCENPNNTFWHRYGGRGIRVCERWRNCYEAFLSDMGRKPSPRHSIDRINNDGNYERGNCRWATASEQGRNKGFVEKAGKPVTVDGVWYKSLAAACRARCVKASTVRDRLYAGWNLEDAINGKPSKPQLTAEQKRERYRAYRKEWEARRLIAKPTGEIRVG